MEYNNLQLIWANIPLRLIREQWWQNIPAKLKKKSKDVASLHGVIPEEVLLFFLFQNYWQFKKLAYYF